MRQSTPPWSPKPSHSGLWASAALHLGFLLWVLGTGGTLGPAHKSARAATQPGHTITLRLLPLPHPEGSHTRRQTLVQAAQPSRVPPQASAEALSSSKATDLVTAPPPPSSTGPSTPLPQQTLADATPAAPATPKPTPLNPAPGAGAPTALARPDHAHSPPPRYPELLREQGIEGVVWLRVRVEADGRAQLIELLRSSGWELLDHAALSAVRHWRFHPGHINQQPIASWVQFPVRFSLEG
ncbi:energy transducer TonB [Roseateles sp. BYS180W]|uniref:Energy transducer TonB n=1 Tax=Roseateles rivi TaxID=3299028 RepID=A0ABW7FXT3_9BURK